MSLPRFLCACLLIAMVVGTVAHATDMNGYRRDAEAIERLVNENYAYLDRFPSGAMPMTDALRIEAAAVTDERSLLRYAERALMLLSDHHAITGSSFSDSWAVVPSYADLWIEYRDGSFIIDAVREGSPAFRNGVRAGDMLVAIGGSPTHTAVAAFWNDLGANFNGERSGFAARILAAGKRDHSRRFTIRSASGALRSIELPSLYSLAERSSQPVAAWRTSQGLTIKINDSLGDIATIGAFDVAMTNAARPGERIIIDLRDTPSGGNTVIARAIMGWFVNKPSAYQVHSLPREARRTGIGRQWIEQVMPREEGKYHSGSVVVCVGRWTGSMGEGLAIGFDALGAQVVGGRMAGLLGAIEDYSLPHSGLVIKLPTERLSAVDGTPREEFRPVDATHEACAPEIASS